MLALFKNVPFLGHPQFRIALGAALLAVGLLVLHDNVILIAIGALLVLMGLASGLGGRTGRAPRGSRR